MPYVKELYYYPIKSAQGLRVNQLSILPTGPENDRRWMLVDAQGRFLSQRQHPKVVLLRVDLSEGLTIQAPGLPSLPVQADADARELTVEIWKDRVRAREYSREASRYVTEYLGQDCHLVCMHEAERRQLDQRYAQEDDEVLFADGFPLLLTTQASLDDLNKRVDRPVDMLNFRPNIVIEGSEAFEEDEWAELEINGLRFSLPKPCSRCSIVSVDRDQGLRGAEPLQTLCSYRKFGKRILFGENAIPQAKGMITVGDELRILRKRMAPHPFFAMT